MPTSTVKTPSPVAQTPLKASHASAAGSAAYLAAALDAELTNCVKNLRALSRVFGQQTPETLAQKRLTIAELQSIWPKFAAQGVHRQVMLERFVEHGEKITALQGMHNAAQTFCFEKVLFQLSAHVEEKNPAADAKESATELTIIRTRAELGILVCQQLELHHRDPLFRLPTTATKHVELLRRFTAIIHECFQSDATAPLALNGVAYAKATVRLLLEQGFLLQLLDFVMWMIAGMESCISFIGAAYLEEWVDLYKLAYDCYVQMNEYASARSFLHRCRAKIVEVEGLEAKTAGSGGIDQTTAKLILQSKENIAFIAASCEIFGIANLSNEAVAFKVDSTSKPVAAKTSLSPHAGQTTLSEMQRHESAPSHEPLQRTISRRLSTVTIDQNATEKVQVQPVEDPPIQTKDDWAIDEDENVTEVVGPSDNANGRPANVGGPGMPEHSEAMKDFNEGQEQPEKQLAENGAQVTITPNTAPAHSSSAAGKGKASRPPKPKKQKKRKNMTMQMQISYEDASDAIKRRQIIVSCGVMLAANFTTDQQKFSAVITCLKSLAGNELNMFYQERPLKGSMDRDKLSYILLDLAFALLCAPHELAGLAEMAQNQGKMTLADDIRALRVKLSDEAKRDLLRSGRATDFPTGEIGDFARLLFRFGQWERFHFVVDILKAGPGGASADLMGEMLLRNATVSFLKSLSGKRRVAFDESKAEIVSPAESESAAPMTALHQLVEAVGAFLRAAQANSRKYGALLTDVINVIWSYCEQAHEAEGSLLARQDHSIVEVITNALECLFSLTKMLPNLSALLHSKIATKLSNLYESSRMHGKQLEVLHSAINRLREERQYALTDEGGTLASITCDITLHKMRIDKDVSEDEEKWARIREFAFLETDIWGTLLRVQLRLPDGEEGGNVCGSRQSLVQRKKHQFKGYSDEADGAESIYGSHTELNALWLMVRARYSDSLSRGDRFKLLEESRSLLELAAKKEAKLLKSAFKKFHHDLPPSEFRCPPPIFVRRSLTSITLRPAPLRDPKDGEVVLPFWYEAFCSQKTPPRVTLNDVEFGGTGQMIRYSAEMEITVSGLTPHQTYYFALAAFDESRNMIGTGIGHMSNGVVTALPLSLLLLWGYQGRISERFQLEEHTRMAKTVLWNHFVRSVVTDEQLANPNQFKHLQHESFTWCRYYETRMDHTSAAVLKLFAQNIAAAVTWDEQELAVYTDVSGTRAVKVSQLTRLQFCRSLMVALDIALRVDDGPLALNVVCKCYHLLAPFMRFDVYSPFLVKAVTKCHEAFVHFHQTAGASYDTVLREVFYPMSMFLVMSAGRDKETGLVDRIVSGTLEVLNRRSIASPKISSSAQLEAVWFKGVAAAKRIRYQSIKNAEFGEFQHHTQMATSGRAGVLYADMPPPQDGRFVEALHTIQLKATHSRGDKLVLESTTTMKDVFQLTNSSREAVYQELSQKFRRHPRYVELLAAVVEQAYHHGEFDLLIKICNDTYEFWTARREAILKVEEGTMKDNRREPPRRKKRSMFTDKRAMYTMTSKKLLAAGAVVRKGSRAGSFAVAARARETRAQLEAATAEPMNEMELSALQANRVQDATRTLRELFVEYWKGSRYRRHMRKLLKLEAPWKVLIFLTHAKAMRQQVQRRAQRIQPKTVSRTPSTLTTIVGGGPPEASAGVNAMPVVTEGDEEGQEAPGGVADLLRSSSLLDMMQFHSQATVLAARGRLWLQMLQACRELWNTTTFMVQHAIFTDEFSRTFLWRACFMSALCIVDFLHEVKLERVLTTSVTTVDSKHIVFAEAHSTPAAHTPARYLQNSQMFASWTDDDGVPLSCQVDLGWCAQFISYTIYHLLQAERYHRVVSVGESFNKVTGFAYVDLTSGYVDRACAALKERGEDVVLTAPAARGKKGHVHLQSLHECRNLVARCGRDSGAGPPATAPQVISAHHAALREANAADDPSTASLVCSELADFFFEQGDTDAAALYWSKCVDSLFGIPRVVERWKHVIQKQLQPASLVPRLGARYCYVAAIALAKMARYSYPGHLDKHLELCQFAAELCTAPLHASLPNPQEPQQYMSYVPEQLIPGFEFLNEPRTTKMGQLVECLDYVASTLIDHSCYHEVLPLLSLAEYVATRMMNSLPFLIATKLKRIQVMMSLGMLPLAISNLTEVSNGYAIPAERRVALGIRALPSKVMYVSSQGLFSSNNARLLKQLVDQAISENVGTCYGKAMVDRIELCRGKLLLELAKTEQGLEVLGHAGEFRPNDKNTGSQLPSKLSPTKSSDSLARVAIQSQEGEVSPAESMTSVAGNLASASRKTSMSLLPKKTVIDVAVLLDRAEALASLIITDVVNEHNRSPSRKPPVDRLVALVLAYRIVADAFAQRGNLDVSIKVMFSIFAALNSAAFEEVRLVIDQTELSRATLLRWRMDCIDWMLRQGYFVIAARNSPLAANEARLVNSSTSYVAITALMVVADGLAPFSMRRTTESDLVQLENQVFRMPLLTCDMIVVAQLVAGIAKSASARLALLNHAHVAAERLSKMFTAEERAAHSNSQALLAGTKYLLACELHANTDAVTVLRYLDQAWAALQFVRSTAPWLTLPVLVKLGDVVMDMQQECPRDEAADLKERGLRHYKEALDIAVASGADHELIMDVIRSIFVASWEDGNVLPLCNALYSICQTAKMKANLTALMPMFAAEKFSAKDVHPVVVREIQAWGRRREGALTADMFLVDPKAILTMQPSRLLTPPQPGEANRDISVADAVSLYVETREDLGHWRRIPTDPYAMALHRRARMLHQLLASISATFSDCRHKDPPDLRSGALMPGGPAAGVAWLNRLPRSWAGVPFDAVGCAVFAKVGRDSRPEKQGGTSSSSPEKPGGKDPQLRRAGSSAGDEGIVILLAMLQSTVTAQIQKQIQGVRQKLSKCKTGPNKSRANSANYDDAGASYNLLLATIEKELSASPRRTCASADFAAGDTPEQTASKPTPRLTQTTLDRLLAMFDPKSGYLSTPEETELVPWLTAVAVDAHCASRL